MIIKKAFSFLNSILLLKNFKYSFVFIKGANSWRPIKKLNFIIQNGYVISKDGTSRFKTINLKRFNFSITNVHDAIEKFIFIEDGDTVKFTPKVSPQAIFHLKQYDNINAANEIFYEGLYNIKINKASIVFDVGANVGIASLFFSKLPFIEKVIAFEPFPSSYHQAIQNLALNNSHKIEVLNFGLSNEEKEISVPNVADGFMGASTTEFFIEEQKKIFDLPASKINIILKKASVFFKQKMDENEDVDYILKLDCEGAEYEIIYDLNENNLLKKFSVIIVEWHFKGPEPIVSSLQKSGFSVLEFSRNVGSPMGMIYAFKK